MIIYYVVTNFQSFKSNNNLAIIAKKITYFSILFTIFINFIQLVQTYREKLLNSSLIFPLVHHDKIGKQKIFRIPGRTKSARTCNYVKSFFSLRQGKKEAAEYKIDDVLKEYPRRSFHDYIGTLLRKLKQTRTGKVRRRKKEETRKDEDVGTIRSRSRYIRRRIFYCTR